MRVGLVIYGELDIVSGGYLYDRQLVEHLERQGDSVHIFSQEPRSYAASLLDNLSGSLVESILDSELDVLLQDELNHPSLLMANRRLRTSMNTPIIAIVHHLRCSEDHPAWRNVIYRRIERTYLRSVDGFIFNGQTTRAVVHEVAGISEPSVVAVPAGNRFAVEITDEEIEARAGRSGGPLQVIFLGSVIPRKGLHTLVEALASLPDDRWVLSVVGRVDVDERYTAQVKQQIRESGAIDNVTMYGTLPDREIIRLMRHADLLAVPSSYEGYGIAYLEGMASGLPAIATTSGAAIEIITHEVNGWLIPPGDSGAIRDILLAARNDREMLARMSLAARQRFLEQPTWEQSMGRIRAFLQTMMGAT